MTIKKKNKQISIIEGKSSPFIFLIPSFLAISTFFYGVISNKLNISITLLLICIFFFYPIINSYKRKIVVTNSKIYFYFLGKKKYSFHYHTDFYMVNFRQDRLGKIFNYGTLIFIDQTKKIYEFPYLSDMETVYQKIIISYEDYMVSKNPEYIRRYDPNLKDSSVNQLDQITKIDY